MRYLMNKKKKSLQITKCVQVLKYIIRKHPYPDIYSVLKMLYIADRAHLLKYGQLLALDRYLKMKYGPVPGLYLNIIQFVRGDKYTFPFDKSIREEFEVVRDNYGNPTNKLRNLKPPDINDFDFLSKTNVECLDATIAKYGHYGFDALKELTHDEIYNSVDDINGEITIASMLNVLDNNKIFATRCSQIFNDDQQF